MKYKVRAKIVITTKLRQIQILRNWHILPQFVSSTLQHNPAQGMLQKYCALAINTPMTNAKRQTT